MIRLVKAPFRLTPSEILLSAGATLCLQRLADAGVTDEALCMTCEPTQYGYTDSASWEPIGPRFVRITDVQAGAVDWVHVPYCRCPNPENYALTSGDILVARSGSVGKSFLVRDVPELAVFASYMIRLRAKASTLPEYLHWCLQSQQFWQQVTEARRGSAMSNINGKMLSGLHFPHPTLEIQKTMVAFLGALQLRLHGSRSPFPHMPHPLSGLSTAVARIEELAARVEQARGLRREAMTEAEALHGAAARAAFDGLVGAVATPIGNIAEVRGGIQKGPHRTAGSNPVRYLTVAHVHRNHISLDDPRYFEVSPEELDRWLLRAGDVLIVEGNGSQDQIGRTALFRGELHPCVHQNHLIRIRPDQHRVLPDYLNLYLNSPVGQDEVQSRSRTTSGLNILSVGRINHIHVPLPSLAQQRHLVDDTNAVRSRVESLNRVQRDTAAALEALLPSVLDKAFRGEL